jgi:hypothetical protein
MRNKLKLKEFGWKITFKRICKKKNVQDEISDLYRNFVIEKIVQIK